MKNDARVELMNQNSYKITVMKERILELEDFMRKLIDEHKVFQINEDLKKYEKVLNRKIDWGMATC